MSSRVRPGMVRELMRREFVSISADDSLTEAIQVMRLARLRHVPVERDGVLVGILSYRDLQDRALSEFEKGNAGGDANLSDSRVEFSMAAFPVIVTPDTPLSDAAIRLTRLGVGCLPVVEEAPAGPRLVGLITERDLLQAAYGPMP